jgi:Fe-S cluster assembly protein SufD
VTTATDEGVAVAAGLAGLLTHPDDAGQGWLAGVRRDAASWVGEHGFPTRKHEDWRYIRLDPISDLVLAPAGPWVAGSLPTGAGAPGVDLGGTRLVFVNGRFAAELSRRAQLPEGVTVTNLAPLLAGDGSPVADLLTDPEGKAFTALNTALAADGAYVHLTAGTVVDQPIVLVFLSDPGGASIVASPRSVIVAEAGSRATLVEIHLGVAGGQGVALTNEVTQLVLRQGADMALYRVQDVPEADYHLALLDVRQDRDSRFSSNAFSLGSAIGRYEVRVRLEGQGAEVELNGLTMSRGAQQHDNPILVEHTAPGCTSRQLYKGVVDGTSHSVFNGHIVVCPGSYGTDARQVNKNLLLSDRAEVDTRPRLEILADDVKCSHGAAVGRLDDDALFYLRSRGIPAAEARAVLITAFAQEMVDLIGPDALRVWVGQLVADRLAGVSNGPDRRLEP